MKHVVMTSGGMGSFITLDIVSSAHPKSDVLALFADTLIEDGDLYRFLLESTSYCGVELVKIKDGRDPWQVFRDVKYVGNTRVDPCSLHLKRNLMDKFISDNFGPDECTCYVGIDANESHRIHTLAERKLPYIYKAPMVEADMMLSQKSKIAYCESRGLRIPDLYKAGFFHNNCGGFCVKAGLAQFALLLEKLPERYDWHVQQERQMRAEVPNAKPFLRRTTNGKQEYIWLEDYREELLSGNALSGEEKYDWGGCGCAVS